MHVGMGLCQANDFPVRLTREGFTKTPKPVPTTPALYAAQQYPISLKKIKARQCKLRGLRRSATGPRPDIRARHSRLAARVNSLWGRGVYRIDDLVSTVKGWQQEPVLQKASSSQTLAPASGVAGGRMRTRGGEVRCRAMSLVGWSAMTYGDQRSGGKRRLSHVIRLTSPTFSSPCHRPRRVSELARKLAESSLSGVAYASSVMIDHVA